MEKIILNQFRSPFGILLLGSYGERLCLCDWLHRRMRTAIDKRIRQKLGTDYLEGYSTVIEQARVQLLEYFSGVRKDFSLPLLMTGTDFQVQVWDQLLKIPYGQTLSYTELARLAGKPDALRAVAAANGANALSIFVPCHRILGANGELTGYAGGLNVKRKLLLLEQGNMQTELFGER
ncbi:MAG: methylated-DNA--[protein]-cysteine S-methyltransferase [Bacteroidales bacterium]|nr:methylated-DNA--[protein]-cysteine S-methyltransferase [Lentimicrobiaceae bacterium]MDD5695534.1 methylated-DNA--[protein]-cysteine S-methyltransferase [Bacteroidales bacterium]